MEWQPIETAPKDEFHVLVATQGYVTAAVWHSHAAGWYETNNDPTDAWGFELFPTHWMPLPAPPTA